MIVDLDKGFWTEMDGEFIYESFILGFSVMIDILDTKRLIEINENDGKELNPNLKYTAKFNGLANTFSEMEEMLSSSFETIIPPEMSPTICQGNSLNSIKKECKLYLEMLYGAEKSNKKIREDLTKKDEIVSQLIDRYMKAFMPRINDISNMN